MRPDVLINSKSRRDYECGAHIGFRPKQNLTMPLDAFVTRVGHDQTIFCRKYDIKFNEIYFSDR